MYPEWASIASGGFHLFLLLHKPTVSSAAGRQMHRFKLKTLGGFAASSQTLTVFTHLQIPTLSISDNPIVRDKGLGFRV